MSATIDTTGDQIMTAVKAFLALLLPITVEIVQGLDNTVPMPSGDFVVMTFSDMDRLTLNNIDNIDPTGLQLESMTPWQVGITLDFFSPSSQQYAATVAGMLRSAYAVDNFTAPVVPLNCSDPKQIPFITAGENWLQRWQVLFMAQVNETVTAVTQTADALAIVLAPIDQTFAP